MRKKSVSPLLRPDGLVRRKYGLHYVLKGIDIVGTAYRRVESVFHKSVPAVHGSRQKRILVMHFGGFGDGIILLSLADAIRAVSKEYVFDLYANADVAAAVQSAEPLFRNVFTSPAYFKHRYITGIPAIVRRMRGIGKRYDYALCLRYGIDNGILPLYISGITDRIAGFRTSGFSFCLDFVAHWDEFQHESENYANVFRSCGIPISRLQTPSIHHSTAYHAADNPYLVVHMGSNDPRKSLDKMNIKKLVDIVCMSTTMRVVVTGVESDRPLYACINWSHATLTHKIGLQTFDEFVSTVLNAAGVITVDTAAAHIAASRVPVLEFFSGIVSKMEFHALGSDVEYHTVDVPCAPCYHPCKGMECMHFDVADITTNWLQKHGFSNKENTESHQ